MQPEDDGRPAIDDGVAVDQNLVLAVVSPDRVHLDPKLTTEPCRHPDGMQARDSKRAIPYDYSSHGRFLDGSTERHPDSVVRHFA